eukprot:Skav228636  [mRNA]  locus=scaffold204:52029:56561:+ [translate_table: standard]
MPPTCKDATRPDQILVSSQLVPMITDIEVHKGKLFPDHDPVILSLAIPKDRLMKPVWNLPSSWAAFDLDHASLQERYQPMGITEQGPLEPRLREWAFRCEQAVDCALRQKAKDDAAHHAPNHLPKKHRGRNVPRHIQQRPLIMNIKTACHGQYNPVIEAASMKLKHWVRQTRRLQSYARRLQKIHLSPEVTDIQHQLSLEWNAITQAHGFGAGFPQWCADIPELGWYPFSQPPLDFVHLASELLRFHCDDMAHHERKAMAANNKFLKHYDISTGSLKLLCKNVRPSPMPCLAQVQQTSTFAYTLHSRQYGLVHLHAEDHPDFFPGQLLQCGEATLTLITVHGPVLETFIHDDDQIIPHTGWCSYDEVTQDTAEVANQLNRYWEQFWRRDDPDSQPTEQFRTCLDNTPDLPPMTMELQDPTLWTSAIRSLAPHSARGVDGWYPDDLKVLPLNAVVDLASIFAHHDAAGMGFGDMSILTLPIAKRDPPTGPEQTRPISLVAMLYRIYARVTTTQLLRQLAKSLPADIVGFVPGRSIQLRMLSLQFDFEQALTKMPDQPPHWLGTTLDIVKCFNALHRPSIYAAMLKIGIPAEAAQFWLTSIQKSRRFWKLGSEIHQGNLTTTGAPEGDSWSVLACLAIAYPWCYHVNNLGGSCTIYADNWAWKTLCIHAHRDVTRFTMNYVDGTFLTIDWSKTWQWSTQSTKKSVKAQLQAVHQGRSVQIVQTARDLGYMLHYGSSQSRATQRERHQKAVAKLQRLRRQHAPMQAKAQVCRHAITQAMFATETYAVGRHWVRDLRSHIALTLSPNRRNTNPYLALALLSEHVIDPELFLLEASIKACRVMMISLPPATRDCFLEIAAQHSCDPLKVRGPAGALAYNLSQLGWQVDRRGHLLTDSAVEFNLFEAPWPSIRKYLHQQFLHNALLTQVIKPGLRYAPLPNAASTIQVLNEFDPKDQQILSYHLTGANMLATQTRHFTESEGKCPLCQVEDSEEHRLLQCPSLSHVRADHPDAIQFLSEADPIHLLLPVIFEDPAWQFDWLVTNTLEPPELDPTVLDKLSHLQEENKRLVCYTDGSCSPPNAPMSARAAFAVVAHLSSTLEEYQQDLAYFLEHKRIPDSFQTLTAAYCQGAQTIQRAETQAVLTITELETECDIYTDSQYVLNWAQTLGSLLDMLQFINRANFDLLRRLWSSLQSGVVRLYKVKAHDFKPEEDPLELTIHKLGNEAADQAAKVAQRRFHTVAPPTASAEQIKEDKEKLRQQFRYRLALHRARADLVSCQQAVQQQPDAYQTWAMKHAQLAQWNIDHPHLVEFSPEDLALMQLCLYGTQHAHRVMAWFSRIQWSPEDPSPRDPGVSWVELALSFKISAQRGIVINSADQSERQIFIPKEIDLNDTQVPFTVQSFSLERCVSQIFQLLRRKLPAQRRQHCASTQILGSQHGRAGLAPRPQFPHQDTVTELLTQVLTTTSQNLDQLQVPVRTPDFEVDMPEVDMTDRQDGWKDRQKRFRLHKKVSRPKV